MTLLSREARVSGLLHLASLVGVVRSYTFLMLCSSMG
jgi:hypothetical protein